MQGEITSYDKNLTEYYFINKTKEALTVILYLVGQNFILEMGN